PGALGQQESALCHGQAVYRRRWSPWTDVGRLEWTRRAIRRLRAVEARCATITEHLPLRYSSSCWSRQEPRGRPSDAAEKRRRDRFPREPIRAITRHAQPHETPRSWMHGTRRGHHGFSTPSTYSERDRGRELFELDGENRRLRAPNACAKR